MASGGLHRYAMLSLAVGIYGCSAQREIAELGTVEAIDFECPSVGTRTVKVTAGVLRTEEIWQGQDPADSKVCLVTTPVGTDHLMYGFHPVPLVSGQADLESAMSFAFSHRGPSGRVSVRQVAAGSGANSFAYEYNIVMQQLGSTGAMINGVQHDVVVIAQQAQGVGLATVSATLRIYYDPKQHLILKRTGEALQGRIIEPYERYKIEDEGSARNR